MLLQKQRTFVPIGQGRHYETYRIKTKRNTIDIYSIVLQDTLLYFPIVFEKREELLFYKFLAQQSLVN